MEKLTINGGVGFSITFKNNITVSVQFGEHHYCDNRNVGMTSYEKHDIPTNRYQSTTAEVAVFDDQGNWLTKDYVKDSNLSEIYDGDDVIGHVKPDDVAKIIDWASKLSL